MFPRRDFLAIPWVVEATVTVAIMFLRTLYRYSHRKCFAARDEKNEEKIRVRSQDLSEAAEVLPGAIPPLSP
jgi:hypothetical protein